MATPVFEGFPKIPRLSREIVVTEKIDGTNAQIFIDDDGEFFTGSRNRWITPDKDNHGFSRWAHEHKDELIDLLGPGHHFGEWWGAGIQHGYGLDHKRFSLFNAVRWFEVEEYSNGLVSTTPVLYQGMFDWFAIEHALTTLAVNGSLAAPGCDKPEGIVIYHTAAKQLFKKLLENDDVPKGAVEPSQGILRAGRVLQAQFDGEEEQRRTQAMQRKEFALASA